MVTFVNMHVNTSYNKIYFLDNIDYLISISSQFNSKRSVALAIGTSSVTFTNMAKRNSLPSVEIATKCAELFGVSIDDIIYCDLKKQKLMLKQPLPIYSINNINEPQYTLNTLLNSKADFGIAIDKETSSIHTGSIFAISKESTIDNYDYVLIKSKNTYSIKQLRYKNTNTYFVDLNSGEVYEKTTFDEIIGVVTQKILPTSKA
ncbi:hypothetical protein L3V86_08385 [Thiotrichales bacterium 19S11-10]|nr:hypothetical protein [Thiotrichales bacterium 19S11-10]